MIGRSWRTSRLLRRLLLTFVTALAPMSLLVSPLPASAQTSATQKIAPALQALMTANPLQMQPIILEMTEASAPFSSGSNLTLAQQAGCGKLVQDFVALVAERGRLDHLAAIVAAYRDMEDAGLGRVRAQVTTAVSLTDAEKDQLKQHLQAELHKQIILE